MMQSNWALVGVIAMGAGLLERRGHVTCEEGAGWSRDL